MFARRLAVLFVLPVAFAGAVLTVNAAPAAAATTSGDRLVSWVIYFTNVQRAKYGCRPVYRQANLVTASQRHSWDMAHRHYFSHTSPGGSTFVTRARFAGYRYANGENIAWGYQTPASLVRAWMNSSGHRANILNCASKRIGVGVSYTSGGTPYWTQMFGRV